MGSYLFLAIMLALTWWLNKNYATIKGGYGEKQVSKQLKSLILKIIFFSMIYTYRGKMAPPHKSIIS